VKEGVTPQISAGEHRFTIPVNYIVAPQFATEFKEENFIKEQHAAPSIIHRIVEEF